jgi:soluble lytic murein transglycosylase-like protein
VKFYYRAEVATIAGTHRLDADLVTAVCLQESAGKTSAYRHEPRFWLRYMADKPEWDGAIPDRVASSYGLMQVMFTTALQFGYPRHEAPEMLFVPIVGLQYGCRVLADRMAWAKGDVSAALASFNGGKTADNQPGVARKRNQTYVDGVQLWLARVAAGDVTG